MGRLPTFEWAREGQDVSPAPHAVRTAVEEWRDAAGTIAVTTRTAGDQSWLQLRGVAGFAFDAVQDKVTAFPEDGAASAEVVAAYRRAALPIIQQRRGHQVLHASGIRTAAGVVAFCGTSGAGKSTLAYAFSRHAYPVWGDDAVCFDATERELVAILLPFDLLLPSSTATYFELNPGFPRGDPDTPAAAPLAAVCVLPERGSSGDVVEVTSLVASDAFAEILKHAYIMGLADEEHRRALVEEYLHLVTTTPVFDVRLPDGLEHLDGLVNTIVDRLGLEPPGG